MKARILLLLAVLPAIILTGSSSTQTAHAEEITLDVPFKVAEQNCISYIDPARADIQIMRCYFTSVIMEDEYQPTELVPIGVLPEPEKTCGEGLTLNTETDECEANIAEEVKPVLTPEEHQMKAIQNSIDRLESKINLDPTELFALDTFRTLDLCARGQGDTEAYQDRENFVVPDGWFHETEEGDWFITMPEPDNSKSYDFRHGSIAGQMMLKAEECRAQIGYLGYGSPDHYKDLIHNEDDFQEYHGDLANTSEFAAHYVMPDRQDGDLEYEKQRAFDALCRNPNYDFKTKQLLGCEITYDDEPVEVNPDKFIKTFAHPLDEVMKYHLTCGVINYDHIVDSLIWDELRAWDAKANCSSAERIQYITSLELPK